MHTGSITTGVGDNGRPSVSAGNLQCNLQSHRSGWRQPVATFWTLTIPVETAPGGPANPAAGAGPRLCKARSGLLLSNVAQRVGAVGSRLAAT